MQYFSIFSILCDTIFHNTYTSYIFFKWLILLILIFLDNLNTGERTNFDDLWNEIKNVKSDHPLFQDNEATDGNQTHCDSSKLRWTYYNSLFFSFTAITTIGMHSALKLEKNCIVKSRKIHFLLFQKWQKINFCTRKKPENCIFDSLNIFILFYSNWNFW